MTPIIMKFDVVAGFSNMYEIKVLSEADYRLSIFNQILYRNKTGIKCLWRSSIW